jgi:hypothetical protein
MKVRVPKFPEVWSSGWPLASARLCAGVLASVSILTVLAAPAAAQEVVLHTPDVAAISGNWARVDSSSGASNQKMVSGDQGWQAIDAPRDSPGSYFEASFEAQAWTRYRVWLRMRASSKWNDSVWVQFSDALGSGGEAIYRIGTGSGLLMNLEECSGCGVSGWGWTGGAWWLSQENTVQFASSGTRTIRIQTREDGMDIDQIVLSPSSYLYSPPGASRDDGTILPRSSGSSGGSGGGVASFAPAGASAGAFGGSASAIPGTIQAEDFDNGGNGVGYYDHTAGNSGGSYRPTDVEVQATPNGGYAEGWESGRAHG